MLRRYLHGMMGGRGVTLPLAVSAAALGPAAATVTGGFYMFSDGSYSEVGAVITAGLWFTPVTVGIGTSYEVRYTLSSGAVTSGSTGVWISLALNPSWEVTRTPGPTGVSSADGTLEVRIASGAVVASCPMLISAEQF
jgi:hypothetical protein